MKSGISQASHNRLNRKAPKSKKVAKRSGKVTIAEMEGAGAAPQPGSKRAEERGKKLAALYAQIEVAPLPRSAQKANHIRQYLTSLGLACDDGRIPVGNRPSTANDIRLHLRYGVETNKVAVRIVHRLRKAGWLNVQDIHGHKALPLRAVLQKALAQATPPVAPARSTKKKRRFEARVKHSGKGTRVFSPSTTPPTPNA